MVVSLTFKNKAAFSISVHNRRVRKKLKGIFRTGSAAEVENTEEIPAVGVRLSYKKKFM
jgi:hypothetical protein